MKMDKIVVVDFGGQYTQLIAKRVRESNVFSEIVSFEVTTEEMRKLKPKGIILSGGPASVYERGAPKIKKEILELGLPVLGICYGMQTITYLLGGGLISEGVKEYGETPIDIYETSLFSGINKGSINVWMSHGDSVDESNLPEGFMVTAKTKDHIAGIANEAKKIYGVQFHPEVTHTEFGNHMISNFVHDVCGCKGEWTPANFIEESKEYIRKTVGKNDVICFVSGGVDSSFVAAILSQTKGIGKVYPIYIEGLMRKNETREVQESLSEAGVNNLIVYKAEDEFIDALNGLSEPEENRKATGNLCGKIQERAIENLNLDPENTFLAQGTLYTDLIESGQGVGKCASNIKSHHNVGCEFIERLKAKNRLVEPNRWIFKDEVRKAAKEIGLPEKIYNRQPFPGPGLAIRIVDGNAEWEEEAGESTLYADKIAKKYGLRAVVAPVKTVGVQGDHRTYRCVAVLRGERDWKKIRDAAKEIPMKVQDVNRVVYQLNSDESTPKAITTRVTKENINILKEIDYKGRKIIQNTGSAISQTIFVLLGADLNNSGKSSVALRAVVTDDFMTVRPARAGQEIDWKTLQSISEMVREHAGSFVIDVTDKPPATTCWE